MVYFVTGGSGFVGGKTIESLASGRSVRALARSEEAARRVASSGAEPVRADLMEVEAEHLRGVDVVIHAAAYVEEYGARRTYMRLNAEGTVRLLSAARRAGVRRFIHISTNGTVMDGVDQVNLDETAPFPAVPVLRYNESKVAAEVAVLQAAGPDFHTVALRPCAIWGPGDTGVLPALRRMTAAGSFWWIDRGRAQISTTHVANLVAAIQAAVHAGRSGEAYFIADDDVVTVREFLGGLAAADGLDLPDRSLPGPLMGMAAKTMEGAWDLLRLRGTPPITRMAVEVMRTSLTVDTQKARRDLGWSPVITRAAGLAALSAASPGVRRSPALRGA
jgi:hypothetical protein